MEGGPMNVKVLVAILGATLILLGPLPVPPQSPQPIKYFGYFYTLTDNDLSRVRSYTNFTYIDGDYGRRDLLDTLPRLRNNGLRAIIDLGKVLWCPQDPNNLGGVWHLCNYPDVNYVDRWNS